MKTIVLLLAVFLFFLGCQTHGIRQGETGITIGDTEKVRIEPKQNVPQEQTEEKK